jgi:hypothetical protein
VFRRCLGGDGSGFSFRGGGGDGSGFRLVVVETNRDFTWFCCLEFSGASERVYPEFITNSFWPFHTSHPLISAKCKILILFRHFVIGS